MDPTYQGEALLLRWGETSTAGRTVTFIIEEDAPIHAFKGLPVGKDGQRFMLVAVPIGNDQQPGGVAEKKYDVDSFPFKATVKYDDRTDVFSGVHRAPKKRWHELSRAQQAGIRCSEERFRAFLMDQHPNCGDGSEEWAARLVRSVCSVDTRTRLDVEEGAGSCWDRLDAEFRQWAGLEPEQRS